MRLAVVGHVSIGGEAALAHELVSDAGADQLIAEKLYLALRFCDSVGREEAGVRVR